MGLLNAEWANTVSAIYAQPEHYLEGKLLALRPRTKELVTLAMIRLAVKDPDAAAIEMDKLRWKTQLSQEERSWVWGVIGKRAAMRLSDDAAGLFHERAGQAHARRPPGLEGARGAARGQLGAGGWPPSRP